MALRAYFTVSMFGHFWCTNAETYLKLCISCFFVHVYIQTLGIDNEFVCDAK